MVQCLSLPGTWYDSSENLIMQSAKLIILRGIIRETGEARHVQAENMKWRYNRIVQNHELFSVNKKKLFSTVLR